MNASSPDHDDLESTFKPFALQKNVQVAPVNPFYKPEMVYNVEIDSAPNLTLDGQSLSRSSCIRKRVGC